MTTSLTATAAPARRSKSYVPSGKVGKHLSRAQELKHQIDELTAQLTTEREFILQHMVDTNTDRMECGDLQVQRRVTHKWTYTPELSREMLSIREKQKWEQQQGKALDSPTVGIALSSERWEALSPAGVAQGALQLTAGGFDSLDPSIFDSLDLWDRENQIIPFLM